MSSIEGKSRRHPAWLSVWVGAALVLACCHSTEASKWAACCSMDVVRGKEANMPSAQAILNLLWDTNFDPDGQARMRIDPESSERRTKQVVVSAMNKFMAAQPMSRPSDYFLGLGMTCRPAPSAIVDVTRCEVEVPIQVKCFSTNESKPWGSPLPDELHKPLPARLVLQVDVSRTALLDIGVQVFAIPGGRLCHR